MQISQNLPLHTVLTVVRYFSGSYKVTSDFLAGSVGNNLAGYPQYQRPSSGKLGIIDIKRGPGG